MKSKPLARRQAGGSKSKRSRSPRQTGPAENAHAAPARPEAIGVPRRVPRAELSLRAVDRLDWQIGIVNAIAHALHGVVETEESPCGGILNLVYDHRDALQAISDTLLDGEGSKS